MSLSKSRYTRTKREFAPGILEVRHLASRIYGIRVDKPLLAKLGALQGLTRAHTGSDLFCVEVDAMDNSEDGALKRFREIVAKAGLGAYFGVENTALSSRKEEVGHGESGS